MTQKRYETRSIGGIKSGTRYSGHGLRRYGDANTMQTRQYTSDLRPANPKSLQPTQSGRMVDVVVGTKPNVSRVSHTKPRPNPYPDSLPGPNATSMSSRTKAMPNKRQIEKTLASHILDDDQVNNNRQKGYLTRVGLLYNMGVLSFMITIALVGASLYFYTQARHDSGVSAEPSSNQAELDVEGDGDNPAEQKPSINLFSKYQTDPEKPRYIRIPSESIEARVKETGLKMDGNVDAPKNIHDVSWYNGTIKPGSKSGVTVMLGHVSGKTMPGVFGSLKNMAENDEINIERGDGKILRYRVVKVEEFEADSMNMASILYDVPKGEQSLRLITCGGRFNRQTNQYDSRTVVYASPVQN